MELRSARVSIRPWRHQDEDLADEWPPYNDPLDPLWNLPRPLNGDDTWRYGFDGGSMRRAWAVDDIHGQLAGRISLREVDASSGRARLGITFGAPFVGRGLGTEALACFLNYYFTDLEFRIMVLDVAAPNERAVRSYERLGFRIIGGDWRNAGAYFDARLLDTPQYEHLQRFFRPGTRGSLEVRFFEMELRKSEWRGYRW